MIAKTPRRERKTKIVSTRSTSASSVESRFRALCAFSLLSISTSCAPRPQQPTHTPRPSNTAQSQNTSAIDPCAAKLHDISGLLLMYYAQYGNLPDTLAEVPGITPDQLQCNGRPFIYRSEGIPVEGALGGRIVVYEPPTTRTERWGVLIVAPREGQPISARVVAVPENIK